MQRVNERRHKVFTISQETLDSPYEIFTSFPCHSTSSSSSFPSSSPFPMYSSKHSADIENRCQKIVKPNEKKAPLRMEILQLTYWFYDLWAIEAVTTKWNLYIFHHHANCYSWQWLPCSSENSVEFARRRFSIFHVKMRFKQLRLTTLFNFAKKLDFCSQFFLQHFLCSHSYHDIMRVEKPFQSNWQQEKNGLSPPGKNLSSFFSHRLKQTREFSYSLNDNVTQCLS